MGIARCMMGTHPYSSRSILCVEQTHNNIRGKGGWLVFRQLSEPAICSKSGWLVYKISTYQGPACLQQICSQAAWACLQGLWALLCWRLKRLGRLKRLKRLGQLKQLKQLQRLVMGPGRLACLAPAAAAEQLPQILCEGQGQQFRIESGAGNGRTHTKIKVRPTLSSSLMVQQIVLRGRIIIGQSAPLNVPACAGTHSTYSLFFNPLN